MDRGVQREFHGRWTGVSELFTGIEHICACNRVHTTAVELMRLGDVRILCSGREPEMFYRHPARHANIPRAVDREAPSAESVRTYLGRTDVDGGRVGHCPGKVQRQAGEDVCTVASRATAGLTLCCRMKEADESRIKRRSSIYSHQVHYTRMKSPAYRVPNARQTRSPARVARSTGASGASSLASEGCRGKMECGHFVGS
ncbi:hypothetical protein EVAR_53492_1 [Eumeta japonica]|uniref:Uncharacterized protein n=1 Tax=Eumeta variegata TaxID=151549 RepID=A0A4C1YUN0_EUMVA|nr:hypothetical protein EVAR_53492_1 [Eumeta japonica]